MAKRSGVPSMQRIARALCSFITRYQSVIVLLYPSNTALHAALAAALTACQTLQDELAKVRELGD